MRYDFLLPYEQNQTINPTPFDLPLRNETNLSVSNMDNLITLNSKSEDESILVLTDLTIKSDSNIVSENVSPIEQSKKREYTSSDPIINENNSSNFFDPKMILDFEKLNLSTNSISIQRKYRSSITESQKIEHQQKIIFLDLLVDQSESHHFNSQNIINSNDNFLDNINKRSGSIKNEMNRNNLNLNDK